MISKLTFLLSETKIAFGLDSTTFILDLLNSDIIPSPMQNTFLSFNIFFATKLGFIISFVLAFIPKFCSFFANRKSER